MVALDRNAGHRAGQLELTGQPPAILPGAFQMNDQLGEPLRVKGEPDQVLLRCLQVYIDGCAAIGDAPVQVPGICEGQQGVFFPETGVSARISYGVDTSQNSRVHAGAPQRPGCTKIQRAAHGSGTAAGAVERLLPAGQAQRRVAAGRNFSRPWTQPALQDVRRLPRLR